MQEEAGHSSKLINFSDKPATRPGAKAKAQSRKGGNPKSPGGPFSDVALAGKTVAEKVSMARAPFLILYAAGSED